MNLLIYLRHFIHVEIQLAVITSFIMTICLDIFYIDKIILSLYTCTLTTYFNKYSISHIFI